LLFGLSCTFDGANKTPWFGPFAISHINFVGLREKIEIEREIETERERERESERARGERGERREGRGERREERGARGEECGEVKVW
jgi:hypothetical protein